MSGMVKLVIGRLATLLLPALLEQLNNVLEELIKQDLNRDGVIGFGGDDDAGS